MNDVEMVKKLGESIGYGHLMEIAHELWAEDLEAVGLPREGAFCVAAEYQIKKDMSRSVEKTRHIAAM